jgi:hypothetical protein
MYVMCLKFTKQFIRSQGELKLFQPSLKGEFYFQQNAMEHSE